MGVAVVFLLKLLFLPIWLPIKLLGELLEHSGRGRRHYSAGPAPLAATANGSACVAAATT